MSKFRFDTHMHLDLYSNRNEVLEYVETMKSYTIAVTNLPDLYERCFHINDGKKYVQFALGFHPELAYQYKNQLQKFDKYLETTRYIGKVGLDFTVKESVNRSTQEKIFSHVVQECAKVGNKILTVHSRRAEKMVLDILEGLSTCIVILHWYSGSITQMDEALRRGYYFSINHQMLQNAGGRKIVDHIPNDRLLIESDAPFTKKLKKSYSVNFMDDIYLYLCERRNITENELSLLLKSNFKSILTKY